MAGKLAVERRCPYTWQDEIVQMADYMIQYDYRLLDIVSNFGYPLTTVYKCLIRELKYIDDDKYIQCIRIMQEHKHKRKPRGYRY
jgi:hypothetical protein